MNSKATNVKTAEANKTAGRCAFFTGGASLFVYGLCAAPPITVPTAALITVTTAIATINIADKIREKQNDKQ